MRLVLVRGAWALALVLAVLAFVAGSLLLLDRTNPPAVAVDAGVARVDTAKRSRILILIVDSWRYETAIDAALMPNVARLRPQGASWRMRTVFEGFSVPAIRAAFTGHAETQLVSFVQNFRFRALDIESFFRDASRHGKRTLVVGNEPFTQFGPFFNKRVPEASGLSMYQADRQRPGIALSAFREGKFDVVICHYESTDWVAHEEGIGSERYRQEFAYADSLVAAFTAARGANDYALVFGDHGHSAGGEHKTGLDIPTFGLLLGPDVVAGATGQLATSDVRYMASHALGITLRGAPYDTRALARMLPITSEGGGRVASASVSTKPTEYAIALLVALVAGALAWVLATGVPGTGVTRGTFAMVAGLFAIELLAQYYGRPSASVMPVLLIGLAVTTRVGVAWRSVLVALGVWFLARAAGAGFVEPSGLAMVIPLYVLAIAAKGVVLLAIAGRAQWRSVIAWTGAITLVELRVWDSPLACAALLVAGAIALVRGRDAGSRQTAALVMISALLYFTLRVPLYQLAWIDLFVGAVWLLSRQRDDAWLDALIVTGSFALTSVWLASILEWGFLYALIPAHVVERGIALFLPLILAKLPLVLVLTLVAVGRTPTRRLIEVLLVYVALRFGMAWLLRLAGAPGSAIWPLMEQGTYLTMFLLAAVVWTWRPPRWRVAAAVLPASRT